MPLRKCFSRPEKRKETERQHTVKTIRVSFFGRVVQVRVYATAPMFYFSLLLPILVIREQRGRGTRDPVNCSPLARLQQARGLKCTYCS